MKKLFILSLTLVICLGVLPCVACNQKNTLSTYEIIASLENNVVVGSEKVTFYNDSENAFSEIKFNLFANAFRHGATYSPIASAYSSQAYYSGESYGEYSITSVKGSTGELAYEICGEDKNVLSVKLEEQLFPGHAVEIYIEYQITLANVISRTGITKNTVNLANFYPILCAIENGAFYECVYYSTGDPYFASVANYSVEFTCDSQYTVASSGELIEKNEQNGKTTYNYQLKNCRNFAFVLSKEYNVLSKECNGVAINYYYYSDKTPEKSLETAEKALTYFNATFGEYLGNTYSVCQTPFIQGGMEFSNLVMISDGLEENAYNEVIVHETAHQWWMNAVGNNEIEYGFLDESLAEYSVVLFYENHPEYNMNREIMIASARKTFTQYCSIYDKLFDRVDTTMLRALNEYSSEYEYVNIAYIKGCIMYDDLRQLVGDQTFFGVLKEYYSQNVNKIVTPETIVSAFASKNADLEDFFRSYYDGKAVIGLSKREVS